MMLIGNFIVPNFPPEIRDQMDFAPFPTIDAGGAGVRGRADRTRSISRPRARNKEDALNGSSRIVLRADVQESDQPRAPAAPGQPKAAPLPTIASSRPALLCEVPTAWRNSSTATRTRSWPPSR